MMPVWPETIEVADLDEGLCPGSAGARPEGA